MAISPESIKLEAIQSQYQTDVAQGQLIGGAVESGFRAFENVSNAKQQQEMQDSWNKLLQSGTKGLISSAKEMGFPEDKYDLLIASAKSGGTKGLMSGYTMLNQWNNQKMKTQQVESKAQKEANIEALSGQAGVEVQDILASGGSDREIAQGLAAIKSKYGSQGVDMSKILPSGYSLKEGSDSQRPQDVRAVNQNINDARKILEGKVFNPRGLIETQHQIAIFKNNAKDKDLAGFGKFESFIPKQLVSILGEGAKALGISTPEKIDKYVTEFAQNTGTRERIIQSYQKMLSGVAVSQQEMERIKGTFQSLKGMNGIEFLKTLNEEIKTTKESYRQQWDSVRSQYGDDVMNKITVVHPDDIETLDDLIAELEGKQTKTPKPKTNASASGSVSEDEARKAAQAFLRGRK